MGQEFGKGGRMPVMISVVAAIYYLPNMLLEVENKQQLLKNIYRTAGCAIFRK
ncbi:MAG: hypothetical protein IPK57_17605 [Chitinophagaceae bacterium]|nr:hypothetical protein [Chitinophagaceae bacterium]